MAEREYYHEAEIRDAVFKTGKKYRHLIQSHDMELKDALLLENVLMTFEMYLFNGDIQKEDVE